jgi:hypothetical protein
MKKLRSFIGGTPFWFGLSETACRRATFPLSCRHAMAGPGHVHDANGSKRTGESEGVPPGLGGTAKATSAAGFAVENLDGAGVDGLSLLGTVADRRQPHLPELRESAAM